MNRLIGILISLALIFTLSSCGDPEFNIDGTYITDTAYGMEDFYSEIVINGTDFDLTIEHFGEIAEENKGTISMDGDTITLDGSNGEQTFIYNSSDKTIYNEDMDTTWVIEEDFVPTKKDSGEQPPEENPEEVTTGDAPDPIPENVCGKYVYSDEHMTATLTILPHDYEFYATSPSKEPLEIKGAAVYAGTNLFLMENTESLTCPLDVENGTIEYGGYIFTKE